MSFGVLEALPKARRTVGDTVTSTGRRGTGGGPWGRPENEGASVTRYGLIFPTFRDAFLRRSQKRGPLPLDLSCSSSNARSEITTSMAALIARGSTRASSGK